MKSKALKIVLAFLGILIFQVLYYQLTVRIYVAFAGWYPNLSNACLLMIHHCLQFLMVFVVTFYLQRKKKVDFGYHIKDWKKGMPFYLAGAVFAIVINLIVGGGNRLTPDELVFQLFFSGLGEEIMYRSIPIVFLTLVWGRTMEIKLFDKITVDVAVILSAVLFSIGHISFQFGVPGINFSWIQLICAFITGIIFGYMYKKTNSIWLCMAAHGVYNTIAILVSALL